MIIHTAAIHVKLLKRVSIRDYKFTVNKRCEFSVAKWLSLYILIEQKRQAALLVLTVETVLAAENDGLPLHIIALVFSLSVSLFF